MYNDRDYTEYLDSLGDPMPWTSQATYTEGDEIVIKHTYTTFTYGHIVMSVCQKKEASCNCFNHANHIMEFVRDENYGVLSQGFSRS